VDNQEKPDKPGAPKWATQAFRRFVDESERLVRIVHLCARGIGVLRGMPKVIEVIARVEDKDGEPDTKVRLAHAREEAELADKEVDQQFPLLHGLGTVALWSLLEAAVLEFVTEWFKNQPDALQTEPVSKLRVRVGDYELSRGDERFSYLAALLDREVSAGVRNGTERFESLLRPLGLGGPVPKGLAKDIFELGQVRNGVVHRGGRVDRKLSESCPWLDLRPEDELKVSQAMFGRYSAAATQYVVLLICRVGERFGIDMAKNRQGVFTHYDESGQSPTEQSNQSLPGAITMTSGPHYPTV
jgi:hypothetical protein